MPQLVVSVRLLLYTVMLKSFRTRLLEFCWRLPEHFFLSTVPRDKPPISRLTHHILSST